MSRLFIGTFVSESDQQKIATLQQQNQTLEETWERKLRWVKPEKIHMTWIFLGSVSADLVQPISDMLSNLVSKELSKHTSRDPLKIEFDHAEIWPDSRKPRQVVLRPNAVDERILQIAKTLRTGLLEFYFEQSQKEEVRTFKPHLTMLRVERRQESGRFSRGSSPRPKLSDIKGMDAVTPLVLDLNKIALIESQIGKGASYKVLHEVVTAPAR